MKNIAIVGAGPAGLTAAYYLLKNGKDIKITIIEKDNVVGGISKSIKKDGYIFDTGIHRFFSKSDEINEIWQEILPVQNKPAYDEKILHKKREYEKNGADPEKEDKVFLIKDRITRIYYGKKFYDYPININFNTIKNLGFSNIVVGGFSYLKSCVYKRKETNLENFYINRFGKKLYSMFFESYTEKVWGRKPSEIDASWGSQRVKGISISEVLKNFFSKRFNIGKKSNETSLIEQFYYPKLGTGQMYKCIADRIKQMGGNIILKADVKKVVLKGQKIDKVLYEKDGQLNTIKCDYLISSMPIKDLYESFDGIKIPKKIYDTAVNLPYRSFMSVALVCKDLKLKNNTNVITINDIVPDSWIYIQDPTVKIGRLQIFNNWSPYLFKDKKEIKNKVMLTLEYFCDENDDYWNMSDKKFIAFAIDEAEKINLINKDDVEKSYRIKIPKAYPAYFDSYKDIELIKNHLNSIQNLYCAGRNGQHRYNNMDHSMMTGIEIAKNIINNDKNKDKIWNVNVEKEYHEIKNKG